MTLYQLRVLKRIEPQRTQRNTEEPLAGQLRGAKRETTATQNARQLRSAVYADGTPLRPGRPSPRRKVLAIERTAFLESSISWPLPSPITRLSSAAELAPD